MRLIDADALREKRGDVDCRAGYVQVVDVGDIDDAPTIEPAKHSRWESYFDGDSIMPLRYYRCSACKIGGCISEYNFCPNCGAKMDLK